MHPLKRVLGHVYFVYAILWFVVTLLIVVIPIWLISRLPEPRQSRWLHPLFKGWMSIYLPLVFILVKRKNKEVFKAQGACVVVVNHNSFADIPITSPYIPGPNKTLAKSELAKIPIFGIVYKSGSILVNRKDENSRRDSFTKMEAVLEKGIHLCLFPEGTRNKKGDRPIQPFYDGAFITAVRAQRPIIPALLFHTKKVFPHHPKAWAWPHAIELHFLPPTSTLGLTMRNVRPLKEEIHQQMEAYFVANRK